MIEKEQTIKVTKLPVNLQINELNEMFESFGKVDKLDSHYNVSDNSFFCVVKFYSK